MSSQAEIREKEDRLLLEMTDLSADLARDMAARAKKAEGREDAERYTRACDRMIRSMRLSIALRRRLERLDARDEARRRSEAVDLRKARLRARLREDIAEAHDHPNHRFELERELDAALAHEALYDRFVEQPLGKVINELRKRLDLPVPPPGRSPMEGEGDREAVEGVETHSPLSGPQPPQSASLTAPPDRADALGEQLEATDLRPTPS